MTVPDLAEVLAEVNRLRAGRDLAPLAEMPKQDPSRSPCSQSRTCPMTVALDVFSSWYGGYRVIEGGETHGLPPILGDFVTEFDCGAYPELKA